VSDSAEFDVLICGASVAGTACALVLAQQGLRVCVVDKSETQDGFKVMCSHQFQPTSIPLLKRVGLWEEVSASGIHPTWITVYSEMGKLEPPHGHPDAAEANGFNVRREVFDPILKRKLAATPGITLLLGSNAQELILDNDRPVGLVVRGPDGESRRLTARLLIGADGRHSRVAQLLGAPVNEQPLATVSGLYIYDGLKLAEGRDSQMWIFGEMSFVAFATDSGRTVVAGSFRPEHWKMLLPDFENRWNAYFALLPDGPRLDRARRTGKRIECHKFSNQLRPSVFRHVPLLGDASISIDFLWGIGLTWALQDAIHLAERVSVALKQGKRFNLDWGLFRYRVKRGALRLMHLWLIKAYTARGGFGVLERMILRSAMFHQDDAIVMWRVIGRVLPLQKIVTLKVILRTAWRTFRHRHVKNRLEFPEITVEKLSSLHSQVPAERRDEVGVG